jgi:hypothetical protein
LPADITFIGLQSTWFCAGKETVLYLIYADMVLQRQALNGLTTKKAGDLQLVNICVASTVSSGKVMSVSTGEFCSCWFSLC